VRHELCARRSICCRSASSAPAGKIDCSAAVVDAGRACSASASVATCDSAAAAASSQRARVGAKALVRVDDPACGRRQRRHRRVLVLHQVRVEARRATHRLAGVVDHEVEPRQRRRQMPRQRVDARRVPQVETPHLQPVAPVGEVRLACVARSGVLRKTRRHDDVAAVAQQQDRAVVPDLHARARHQRHAPRQIKAGAAPRMVHITAVRAQLIVEEMKVRIARLADVADARLVQRGARAPLSLLGFFRRRRTLLRRRQRRVRCRRQEDRLAAQLPDLGALAQRFVVVFLFLSFAPHQLFLQLLALLQVGAGDLAADALQSLAQRGVDGGEDAAVGGDLVEQREGVLQACGDGAGRVGHRVS
jgi:hypothetical protein